MKGRTKDKIKFALILITSIVATVITVSIISGRLSTSEIIIVKKDGLNLNIPLDQQLEFFEKVEVSKSEAKAFNDSIVTDFSQLIDKKTSIALSVGSPIPLNALVEPNSGGKFATSLPEGQTVHMLPDATAGLPPVEKGDKINVGITFKERNELGEDITTSSILLYELEVVNIIGTNIYVQVDLEQSVTLFNAQSLGNFFYQLPGQFEIPFCSELEEVDIDVDCLPENFFPGNVKQNDIINKLRSGKALNEDEVEDYKRLKRERSKAEDDENDGDSDSEDNQDDNDKNEMDSKSVGETLSLDKINITLTDVDFTKNDDVNYDIIGSFKFEFENKSEDDLTVNLSNFKLLDGDDYSYNPLNLDEEISISGGEKVNVSLAFDIVEYDKYKIVLKDSKGSDISYWTVINE